MAQSCRNELLQNKHNVKTQENKLGTDQRSVYLFRLLLWIRWSSRTTTSSEDWLDSTFQLTVNRLEHWQRLWQITADQVLQGLGRLTFKLTNMGKLWPAGYIRLVGLFSFPPHTLIQIVLITEEMANSIHVLTVCIIQLFNWPTRWRTPDTTDISCESSCNYESTN